MPRAARPGPALAAIGETPLTALPGCGPKVAEKLAARGLLTLQDLWLQLPRQYEDRTRLTPIALLQPGVAAQVEGRVSAVERGFRGRPVLKVAIEDDSYGTLVLRFFHFRSQQVSQFAVGARIRRAVIGSGAGPNASNARNDSEGPGDRGEPVEATACLTARRVLRKIPGSHRGASFHLV